MIRKRRTTTLVPAERTERGGALMPASVGNLYSATAKTGKRNFF